MIKPALNLKSSKGFTLVELLIVIGVLTILLAIVLIAINPARQFAQANNVTRKSDVNSILNAVSQYMAANRGEVPTGLDGTVRELCAGASCTSSNTLDLCDALVDEYIADLPHDPATGFASPGAACSSDYSTGYTAVVTNGRVTVAAPEAELNETISVNR